jgi:hypothetical protein
MEIIINDEKVEYTIEKEKNLGDVLSSLEAWVSENGGIINRVCVDERDIFLDRQTEDLRKSISSIGKLTLQTSSRFEHALSTLHTVDSYVSTVVNTYLKSRDVEDYELIIEGINLIAEGMEHSVKALHLRSMVIVDERGRSLREVLKDLHGMIEKFERQYVDGEGRRELKQVLTDLQTLLPKTVRWAILKNSLDEGSGNGLEVSFLKTALCDLESISVRTLGTFEKIGENLQIGRDGEALGDLFRVTELMDEIVYVLQFFMTAYSMDIAALSRPDFGAEELFKKVTAALREVEESFRNEDLITVGDMLEYEVKSLFEAMIDLLHRIGVFIQ